MTKDMCKRHIRKWFEFNRADYCFYGFLTDDFLEKIYKLIYNHIDLNSDCDLEIANGVDEILTLYFNVGLYKTIYNKARNIFQRQFSEIYDRLEKHSVVSLMSKAVLECETKGLIMKSVLYDTETNSVKIDEKGLDDFLYNEIKNILNNDQYDK